MMHLDKLHLTHNTALFTTQWVGTVDTYSNTFHPVQTFLFYTSIEDIEYFLTWIMHNCFAAQHIFMGFNVPYVTYKRRSWHKPPSVDWRSWSEKNLLSQTLWISRSSTHWDISLILHVTVLLERGIVSISFKAFLSSCKILIASFIAGSMQDSPLVDGSPEFHNSQTKEVWGIICLWICCWRLIFIYFDCWYCLLSQPLIHNAETPMIVPMDSSI